MNTHTKFGCSALMLSKATGNFTLWGGHGETLDWEDTAHCNMTHDSRQKHSSRLWSGLSVWSTAGLAIKGRLWMLSTSTVDNIMTTAPICLQHICPWTAAAILQTTKNLMKKFLVMKGHILREDSSMLALINYEAWNWCFYSKYLF